MAGPAPEGQARWVERVHVALVDRLTREHAVITGLVDDLLDRVSTPGADEDVDTLREHGTTLLETLLRHRQRGSDLVYEAYQIDIGGET